MNTPVETQAQLEEFLRRCPDCGLVFDSGHLAAAKGNCLAVVRKYHRRILMVHVKDVFQPRADGQQGKSVEGRRFCELGAGNSGPDNAAVLKELVELGYEGWVCVEHDSHLREPELDLAISRDYIRKAINQ